MPAGAHSGSEAWLDPAIAAGLILAGVATLLFPQQVLAWTPDCLISRVIGGGACWGCGITHAIVEFVHLEFRAAVAHNPLVLAVMPLLCWTSGRFVWKTVRKFR